MRIRIASLVALALVALPLLGGVLAGCGAAQVEENSVKNQEADTAARIKAKGGDTSTSRD